MSTHICLSFMVLMMMFYSILDVVKSTVPVVVSPGCFMRLPPAVILKRLGSVFCARQSTTMFAYVTVRSEGTCLIYL